ncbi:MAG: adenylate/guanylate cyclase domain-containing protein, partial [Chitinophagaceae bacterium]
MRQLAAIMFSDMTGYTALMQISEQLAKEKRQRLKEVLERSLGTHNGKLLQYYGDGALSIFGSAIDGVLCAINIQQTLLQHPKVDIRIGIHTGDILIEDDLVYGDGVNLASRIESLAVPGSIFVSEKVYDEIRNHKNIAVREMGYFELKNVEQAVRIFAINEEDIVVPARSMLKGKTKPPVNRLAVLPFVNMSADSDNEYFSDGITEELLNALTRVKGLQVTSRTSAFAYKGKNTDIREIGTQLNVDRILEGSVRRAGNRVRITAQLINAVDGYHIWSENYDRELTDIFNVQDEISDIIANRCRENLTFREVEEKLAVVTTRSLEAYTQYLKGLHFHNKLTPGDARKAIEYFEVAIKLESTYAEAYAMAATNYAILGTMGQILPATAFEIVHRYSDKALQLDNSCSIGYAAKGAAYLLYDWEWKKAYEALMKAIDLNPATTSAHQLLCFYYMIIGRKSDAVAIMQRAKEIDPLSPVVNHYLAEAYFNAGSIEDALQQADSLLEMHPQMRITLQLKGWCIGIKGDWQAAVDIFQKVHEMVKHPLKGLTPLGCAYAKLGNQEKAMDCISKTEQRQLEEPGVVLDPDLAMLWWSVGNRDKTFHHLF